MATLTGKDLIAIGLKPGPKFPEILKQCNALPSQEEALAHAASFIVKEVKKEHVAKVWSENCAYSFILGLEHFHALPCSVEEKHFDASHGEVKRWLESGSVIINGQRPKPEDTLAFPIWQLVFHPGGIKKCTMVGCAIPCLICKEACCCEKGPHQE